MYRVVIKGDVQGLERHGEVAREGPNTVVTAGRLQPLLACILARDLTFLGLRAL